MVIDLILDRKDGKEYNFKEFFENVFKYGKTFQNYSLINAFAMGNEKDIKKALCDYIIYNDYNQNICDYIKSVKWIIK